MDHLKDLFHEDLADPERENVAIIEGRVHIRERHWAPGDLLKVVGDAVYNEVFTNWMNERREALLDKAEELLSEYDQNDRFETLKTAFRRDAVIPFVGAGLSMASGYPGWTDFLHRLRRSTRITEPYLFDLLQQGQYERAAQELAEALGAGFNEQVEAKFGLERDLHGPVQLLPYVFSASAITTNFDDVLKRSYDNAGRAFTEIVIGTHAHEFPRILATGRPVLLKLHGTATKAAGRVLTAREYDAAYSDPQSLQRLVKSVCTRTLLFMGCSLTVDRLLSAIGEFVQAEGHDHVARHYAFLAAPDEDVQRQQREATLAQFNIYPIWYHQGEDDESIEAMLYRLADGVVTL